MRSYPCIGEDWLASGMGQDWRPVRGYCTNSEEIMANQGSGSEYEERWTDTRECSRMQNGQEIKAR